MKALLQIVFGFIARKTDGYKTKIGGVGLILTALLGLASLIWPDQGLPQMSIEAVIGTFSLGMTALGLGGKAEKLKNAISGQSGRITLEGFLVFAVFAFALTLAGGCAIQKDSRATLAAKSLLGTQAVVIGLAQSADDMCQAGTLTQDRCDQVHTIYDQARASYDVAAEMLIIAIESGESQDSPAWANYQVVRTRFSDITSSLQGLATEFGVLPKTKESLQ